jgi:predicted amidophosphoribosyltransferase
MPLTVVCFSTYLTKPQGDQINGYAHVPVRGALRRLDESNKKKAILWFAQMVADYLNEISIKPPLYLVPVPSHKATVASPRQPRTSVIAQVIAIELGSKAVTKDVLRWKEEWVSAREGGTRDPVMLYSNLKIVSEVRWNYPVVMLDDVLTSGGHLQACAAILKRNGAIVKMAVCGGKTVQDSQTDPFAIRIDDVEDFTPSW